MASSVVLQYLAPSNNLEQEGLSEPTLLGPAVLSLHV